MEISMIRGVILFLDSLVAPPMSLEPAARACDGIE